MEDPPHSSERYYLRTFKNRYEVDFNEVHWSDVDTMV